MRTIYKYSIPIERYFDLNLPLGAEILTFQTQNGQPMIWALVNPENEMERRFFTIHGTGQPDYSEYSKAYIGTIQTGMLVWHLFETKE